jgi:anti-sigma regulatory factor (Ser/Thr protein kinase)
VKLIHSGNLPALRGADLELVFASTVEEKARVLEELLAILQEKKCIGLDDLMWARLVLDEALVNAVRHGHAFDASLKVTVRCFFDTEEWAVTVSDQGKGFTEADVPSLDDEDSLGMNHGRGVNLMRHFMDTVQYYDGGRVLLLKKKRSEP